jgi:hypothetical protein
MGNTLRAIVVAGGALALAVAILTTIYLIKKSQDGLVEPPAKIISVDFYSGSCASESRAGVRSAKWDEAGQLQVLYTVRTNCGLTMKYAGLRVGDDTLTLEYTIPRSELEPARCTCGYELDYRIKGLEKKDYVINGLEVSK